jgi:hypothetical protein
MKTLTQSLILAVCLAGTPLVFSAEEKALPDDIKATAVAWLGLLDQDQYGQTWKEAFTRFKAMIDEKTWVGMMTKQRKALGKPESREFETAKFSTSLPRQPDGEYWVLKFHTVFSGPKPTTETVTLAKDKDAKWRVMPDFYTIRPST